MAERGKVAGYFWFKVSIAFGVLLGLLLLAQTVYTYRLVSRDLVRKEAQNEADRTVASLARLTRGARDSATLTPAIEELIKDGPEKIAWMRILATDGNVIASAGSAKLAPKWTADGLRNAAGGRGQRQDLRATEAGDILLAVTPLRFGGFGRSGGGPPPGFGFDTGRGGPDFGRGGPQFDAGRARGGTGDGGRGVFPPGDQPIGVLPQQSAAAAPAQQPSNVPPQNDASRPGFPPAQAGGPSGQQGRGPGRGGPGGPYVETAIYLDGVSISFAPLLQNLIVGCSAAIALLVAVVVIGLRFRHYLQGKQYEEELALARRVQHDLFPTESVPTGNIEFAARFIPSRQVGGDLYDIFETDDGGVGMVLGDVSGKGLSAALLMGVVQGAVRTSSDAGLAEHHEHSAERLNHLLCMKTARERFVSLFWCYLNRDANHLSYINAGHLPALLVRERFGKPDVWRLEQGGGPVLGVVPGARYKQAEVDIEPGDLLVVFSDGISEAANAAGDEFGEEGIIESVMRNWKRPAAEVCDAVLADIGKFLDKEVPHDDQTLMVVRLEHVGAARDAAPLDRVSTRA
jgi:serine phosphatase RsbU (regulator of sigma subunit)